MQRVKSILVCVIFGSLLMTGCALPNSSSDPSPVETEIARTVLPDRYPEGNPSPELKDVHDEVVRHIKDNPDDFGGAYIDFAYEAVNVWTAEENAWSEAEFAALRNELDPNGELIRHVGNGKSLSYLEDLRAELVSTYKPGESSKISEIYVDPVHNGVRTLIQYESGDPSLERMPLAIELSAFAPEVYVQSVGSPNVVS